MSSLPMKKDDDNSLSINNLFSGNPQILDSDRNLTLENSSDKEFLEMFFALGIEKKTRGKKLSENTMKAYRNDAQTLFEFMNQKSFSFREIGFPEVYAYNEHINMRFAPKTAIRKLDFFRRLLLFGYKTHFYRKDFSAWIEKPQSVKGHYSSDEVANLEKGKPAALRQLDQPIARGFSLCFKLTVKNVKRNEPYRTFLETRNELIGHLLYGCGLRASEICNLDFYHFRRKGNIINLDVVGKGNKHRVVPLKEKGMEIFEKHTENVTKFLSSDLDIDELPVFFSPLTYRQSREVRRITYYMLYKIVKNGVKRAIDIVEQECGKVKEKASLLSIDDLTEDEKDILRIGKLLNYKSPKAAKDGKVSPHWFRHTYVTMLLERGVPLATVKDLVGHSDISTTNIYLEKINEDRKHEQLNELDDLGL